MTSVKGHVMSTSFYAKEESWDVDPRTLFDAPIRKVATEEHVVKHLKHEGKGVDYLVLW